MTLAQKKHISSCLVFVRQTLADTSRNIRILLLVLLRPNDVLAHHRVRSVLGGSVLGGGVRLIDSRGLQRACSAWSDEVHAATSRSSELGPGMQGANRKPILQVVGCASFFVGLLESW